MDRSYEWEHYVPTMPHGNFGTSGRNGKPGDPGGCTSEEQTCSVISYESFPFAGSSAAGKLAGGLITWSPHSVFDNPDHRPALSSSPGSTARVQ
jgi:hypothetical protein